MSELLSNQCFNDSSLNFPLPDGNPLSPQAWFERILTHLSRETPPGESDIQRQVRLLRFLRRNRLEGLAAISPQIAESEIYRRTVREITLKYERRSAAQLALWEHLEGAGRQRGISLIPLKGLALLINNTVPRYARFFEDLDLLIEPHAAEEVIELLTSAGFSARHTLSKGQACLALRSMKNLNFFSKDSICSVDIHLSTIPRGFPEPVTNRGYTNSPLCRDYTLMIIHCLKNRWRRLDKVLDLAHLECVMTVAERSHAEAVLRKSGYAQAFEITRELLSALASGTACPATKGISVSILTSWFSGLQIPGTMTMSVKPVPFFFNSWAQCATCLWCRAFFPTENDIRLLPSAITSLLPAIVIRLARIISILPIRGAKGCWQVLSFKRPAYVS